MKQTLYYLRNFNNYFNRQVKLPQSKLISDYEDYIAIITDPTNFNPNDGVRTTILVNYNDLDDDVDLDYLLTSEDNVNIKSKWFIIDRFRNRQGQWTITLFRDLLSEYYDSILTSPMFIERALLGVNNPLIYNNEGMVYNQIKKSEELLTDETECAWIVGYCDRESDLNLSTEDIIYPYDYELESLQEYEYYNYITGVKGLPQGIRYKINIAPTATPTTQPVLGLSYTFDESGKIINSNDNVFSYTYYSIAKWPGLYQSAINNLFYSEQSQIALKNAFSDNSERLQNMNNYINPIFNYTNISNDSYVTLMNENNKVIKIGDTYYKIEVKSEISGNSAYPADSLIVQENSGGLFNEFNIGIDEAILNGAIINKSESFYPSISYELDVTNVTEIKFSFIPLSTQLKISKNDTDIIAIPAADRYHTVDTPYDIFAIPFGKVNLYENGSSLNIATKKSVALQIAMNLFNKNTGSIIYDIQILPYCPVRYLVKDYNPSNTIDIGNNDIFVIYTGENPTNRNSWESCIFFANSSTFTFDIRKSISLPIAFENEKDNINLKISNEVDFWRLCSPNYASEFEFSVAKNGGSIEYFNVDCCYKPYNPYIHINPNFKGLYGRDFNDPRGLILSGDFSLPKTQDQWALYEINNKNYKESFNRQIESMDTLHEYSFEQQKIAMKWNAIATGVNAGTNVMAGSTLMGAGGYSAGLGVASGLLAGAGSYIAGYADLGYSELAYAEQRDYTKDIFELNLGNIKALPNTLIGVGALNNNNKIFPVLEYYSCTDEEKEILLKKIKYNSFNVQEIGELQNYISDNEEFVKGRLIRLILTDGQTSDFHIAKSINDELIKGVYI